MRQLLNLKLTPIQPDEDITNAEYTSDDCQQLLAMWKEYYPKIGFNLPWVGYFVKRDNTIFVVVHSQVHRLITKLKFRTGRLRSLKAKAYQPFHAKN